MRQNTYCLSNTKISASDIGNENCKTSVLAQKKTYQSSSIKGQSKYFIKHCLNYVLTLAGCFTPEHACFLKAVLKEIGQPRRNSDLEKISLKLLMCKLLMLF